MLRQNIISRLWSKQQENEKKKKHLKLLQVLENVLSMLVVVEYMFRMLIELVDDFWSGRVYIVHQKKLQ